jgi:hypothetical protein
MTDTNKTGQPKKKFAPSICTDNKLKINFFALPGRRTEEHLLEDDDSLFLDDTVPGTP